MYDDTSALVTRRAVIAGSAAIGVSTTPLARAATRAAAQRAPARPNIVFIMADDLGYADVSCYGRRDYRTPHIDSLATQGMRFVNAYANSSVCTPTRVALATGRYQYRLPIGLEEPLSRRDVGLPPSHPTIASLLRRAGYTTMLVGKWHLGAFPKYGPLESGYDHFWGYRGGAVDYFTHKLAGRPDLWDGNTPVETAGYMTDLLGDRAVAALDDLARSSRPFFMSLHFSAPHWPWEDADDDGESRRLAQIEGPAGALHFDGGTMKTYADMVVRMDMQIGRVLQRLEKLGLADDTIVVFTSDNGGERFSDTWPFKGIKTELLEGGIRVPAIIRWPRHVPAGRVSDQSIISMDWVATLLHAAGGRADPAFPLDGVDLSGVIAGGATVPRTLYWRQLNMLQQACREGPWKYLKINQNSFLFNLDDDPMERANLKLRHPDIFAALQAKWQAWDATMLPLDPKAYSHGFGADLMADHFGVIDTIFR